MFVDLVTPRICGFTVGILMRRLPALERYKAAALGGR